MGELTLSLLFFALILLACVAAGRLSGKAGVPALLLFLVLGMLCGVDGPLGLDFSDYALAERACSVALIFIMFYGGFGTRWEAARPIAGRAVLLSTVGVAATALLTAGFCRFCLGMTLGESFLTGAVISSTDAASVFSILRAKKLGLKENTASLLELESGSNDPCSYLMTVVGLTLLGVGAGETALAVTVIRQVAFGLLLGPLVAAAAIFLLKKLDFSESGMDIVFVFAVAVLAYALPTAMGGNGYLGTYLAGLLMGNAAIPRKTALVPFFDGVTGLAQMALFCLLGLLATPSELPAVLPAALGVTLFLTFVSRPVAVFVLLKPFHCSTRQCLLVAWAGLRGAASIVFAVMAVVSGAEVGHDLFHMVFCVCLFSVALQGSLLPRVAQRLEMTDTEESLRRTFTDYQDERLLHLTRLEIGPEHPWRGRRLADCPLPMDGLVVMIRRGEESVIPGGETVLLEGDLLVLSTPVYQEKEMGLALRELPVGRGSPWVGKAIRELDIPKETLIVLVRRSDGTAVVPKGGTILCSGDTLVVTESGT